MDESKIKAVMATVFETHVEAINEESTMDNVEHWDSLAHIQFVLALEEEFDVSIPDEEVGNMTSYRQIKRVLLSLAGE